MIRQLGPHDAALWRTVRINQAIDAGSLAAIPPEPTTFAPPLGPTEHVLAGGPFRLFDFRPAGDGSYVHRGGFFLGTGPAGLAIGAGLLAGQAIGNANRRAQAAQAAQPRWMQCDQGWLSVSDLGFHLQTSHGLLVWEWQYVHEATLTGPGQVMVAGQSTSGPVRWILESDWAELLFTLWARVRHPAHPQLVGGWLPAGWAQRVQAAGYALPSPPAPRQLGD